jgi:hypothetical protein
MAVYTRSADQPVLNRSLLWAGAGLIGAGALLGLAGSAVCGAAAVIGLKRHVSSSGMAPSELALHHWQRAKTAASAGASTWRGQVQLPTPRQGQAPAPARVG